MDAYLLHCNPITYVYGLTGFFTNLERKNVKVKPPINLICIHIPF